MCAAPTSATVPEGFVVHTESTTSILFAAPPSSTGGSPSGTAPVFLNPVQEYNRDLSVVAIRTWSETRQAEKRQYWEEGLRRKWARKRARDVNGAGGEKFAAARATEAHAKGKEKEGGVEPPGGAQVGEEQAGAKRRKADDGGATTHTAGSPAPLPGAATAEGGADTTPPKVSARTVRSLLSLDRCRPGSRTDSPAATTD